MKLAFKVYIRLIFCIPMHFDHTCLVDLILVPIGLNKRVRNRYLPCFSYISEMVRSIVSLDSYVTANPLCAFFVF